MRCHRCQLPFDVDDEKGCLDCAEMDWAFDRVVALYQYEQPFSKILAQLKYQKKRFLVRTLEVLLQQHLDKIRRECGAVDWIVPVPMDRTKEKERGFNQSHLVARFLEKNMDGELCLRALKRVEGKDPLEAQAQLSRKERIQHLENKIFLGKESSKLKKKKILLVDDVVTTGSTVNECARVLKTSGAKEVVVFSLARTKKRSISLNI